MANSDDIGNILGTLDEKPDEFDELQRHIDFDLNALRSVEVADPRKVLRWSGDWTVRLDSGRDVYVGRCHQYAIYAGLLSGIPTYIAPYLVRAIRDAKKLFGGDGVPIVMLEPVLRSLPIEDRPYPEREKAAILPPICTIVELHSSNPSRDDSEVYSSLVAIWFMDRFGLPDDEDILRQLRALDWKCKAVDWTP